MTFKISSGDKVLYEAQERQELLHTTTARQILYGGAAGGGKSHSIRWDLITLCIANPGCQAFLFRRTRGELETTHIRAIKMELAHDFGRYAETRNAYEFDNSSILYMCYCEREDDLIRYLSAEMHAVGIDEASTFTPRIIQFLKTRNRLGGWTPKQDEKRLPRFAMGSNPGGPGHAYLKTTFVDAAPPETIFHDPEMRNPEDPDDKGWASIYIPAKIKDNKYIEPSYLGAFGGLPIELQKAYREGDWDVVVGAAVHSLSKDKHQLRSFAVPRHWTKFQSMDWGSAKPFSVGWYCVSEGALLEARDGWPERWIPSGAVIRYNEWYGWNGRPNEGCRYAPQKVGKGIVDKEDERDKEVMDYRVADNEMWAQKHGPSAMEWFEEVDPRLIYRKSLKDRKRNYQEVLARLAGNPNYMEDQEEDDPMFFCTVNCKHFWRTIPGLLLDEMDPEKGPSDKVSDENHVYDEWAYALRSRPYVTTERDRWEAHWAEDIRKSQGKVEDPYATR